MKKQLYITIENDDDLEECAPEAIVPVVFSEYKRKIELECYYSIYPEVRNYLLTEKKPFSKEALNRLDEILTKYLSEIGYERPEKGKYRYYESMVMWDMKNLNREGILENSVMLNEKIVKGFQNRTPYDLEELLRLNLPAAVSLENREVVSICTVNEHSKGQRLLEAAVFTATGYRNKGYGTSNVALLSESLLKQKMGVVYCASRYNRPSIKIAKSLGFRSHTKFYGVDAYKKEENSPENGENSISDESQS